MVEISEKELAKYFKEVTGNDLPLDEVSLSIHTLYEIVNTAYQKGFADGECNMYC